MIEKLELKHLAPYLPYELKVKNTVTRSGATWTATGIHIHNENVFVNLNKSYTGTNTRHIKPILRTMSDLPDEIFEDFGFADEEDFLVCLIEGSINYCDYIKLISQHFDVFGLIDAGLAIDINTLPELLNT